MATIQAMLTGSPNSSQGPQFSATATLHGTVESSLVSSVMSTDASFVASGQLPVEMELLFRRIFRLCDSARSGGFNECELMLGCTEYREVANFFGLPRVFKEEDGSVSMATKMFQAIDSDEDHEITWEEFRSFFAARFAAVLAMQQQLQARAAQPDAFPCEQQAMPTAQKENAACTAVPELDIVTTKASTRTSSRRQDSTCSHCGQRLGLVPGFVGCGFHSRLHEGRCQNRPGSILGKLNGEASPKLRASERPGAGSSVMTDVPEDSGIHSTVHNTMGSTLESTIRISH